MSQPEETIWYTSYTSPVGTILVASSIRGVCRLATPGESMEKFQEAIRKQFPECKLVKGEAENRQVVRELEEYFAGKRKGFTCNLDLRGTEFQSRVWKTLQEIPYGETRAYEDIAGAAGCAKGCRAVGQANGANPVSIIVPCHRVIAKGGKLGGYGGGLEMKTFLLELERRYS